jgi:D-3-phosphoglycerate dehydrogenase
VTGALRVGISADFGTTAQGLLEPVLAERFDPTPGLEYEFMAELKDEVTPDQIRDYDAVITLHPRYTADSLRGAERLAVIARWGVGYNMIDVQACTDNDVLVAITRDAVRRPVAEGMMTLLLGITHHLTIKDRLVRAGRWAEKARYPGVGVGGRVLGLVGIGNIGSELVRLLAPFGLGRLLAFDPYVSPARAAELGVELVRLETLLAESDFVCVSCPLTRDTHHLIAEPQLDLMKPTAFLVNAARGPIVDQAALTRALQERRIAGAGLDVFEQEPLPADDPLTRLDNVILSPHAIGWTDALVRGNGVGACENVLAVLKGKVPEHVVNREVLERPGFRAKLGKLRDRLGVTR